MTNRKNVKRNEGARKRVSDLVVSALVLAGLASSGYSALVLPGNKTQLSYDATRAPMVTTGSVGMILREPTGGVAALAALPGSTISVTTTAQGVADDGQCSLQEAIYSANLDFGVAPSSFNPIVTFDTGCAPGSGDVWGSCAGDGGCSRAQRSRRCG